MSEHRRLMPGPLVIASHNPGKLYEIRELVLPFGVELVSATSLGLPEPEETGATFRDNAELKARAASSATGMPALADDSGLAVYALDGRPGVLSARWAGPEKDFGAAMEQVHHRLVAQESPEPWDAQFVCALSLAWPDGHVESFEGRVNGHLVWPPRGDRGFGYDPMFVPVETGEDLTFAEMEPEAKHAISHRAKAFAQLVAACLADE